MAEITIEFKYDVPDKKWASTNLNKDESTWIYKGPENLYVPVDKDGKLGAVGAVDAAANPGYKFSPRFTTVLVDVKKWPIIGALYYPSIVELNSKKQIPVTLPDGRTIYTNEKLLLTEVYSKLDVEYNFNTDNWSFPFATNNETWDGVRTKRDGLLANSDRRVRDDAPQDIQDAWKAYRQELRDITTTWAGYDPAEVIFPPEPIIVPPSIV